MTGSHRLLVRGVAFGLPILIGLAMVCGCPPVNPTPGPNDTNTTPGPNTITPGNSGITGQYVGATRCGQCHGDLHTQWAGTLHSQALETLEAIGQGTNAQCLPCHTVGYGQDGGFKDRATTNDLAEVGCEACHGPAKNHVSNISDLSKLPKIDIAASVCGACHTDEHHPNYEDWQESDHATEAVSNREVIDELAAGSSATTCGLCHSGDSFYLISLGGNATYSVGGFPGHPVTIGNDYFKGRDPNTLNTITCAICHDPHTRTGNASNPDPNRDFQLRFAEVKAVAPTNTNAAATNPARFNLCGQCHHARTSSWYNRNANARPPHPSAQANFYFGEMPLDPNDPNGGATLVPSRIHVHSSAPNQCATCHVYRKPAEEGIAPAVSGHTFEVNFTGCAASGCHSSADAGQTLFTGIQGELASRLAQVKTRLDAWSAANGNLPWDYNPNATGSNKLPNDIQKSRFLYYYAQEMSGQGVHNPGYMRDILNTAQIYANTTQTRLP